MHVPSHDAIEGDECPADAQRPTDFNQASNLWNPDQILGNPGDDACGRVNFKNGN
jgi:hypothetical protein